MPYLAFRPAYRIYWDDWGLLSHAPELRMYVPTGPIEWRVTGRYYTQNHVSFWATNDGVHPAYLGDDSAGLPCKTCFLRSSRETASGAPPKFFTADPKLGNFDSEFFELSAVVQFRGIHTWRWLPGHDWLADGILQLSYGHYFNSGSAHAGFGDAEVAGLTLEWPL
jgi:hypothetical protein